jgi:fructokinase
MPGTWWEWHMAEAQLYGAVELGGTKTVLAIGSSDGGIIRRLTLPTRPPEPLLADVLGFFNQCGLALAGMGVGAFGPVNIDPALPDHGRLLGTNKPGWSGFDLLGALSSGTGLPVSLVTDVGAAAMGEAALGALRGARLGVYLTIGTGIGGAIVIDGALAPALLHPEMGHVSLQRAAGDNMASTCQYHANCAEGLAAGPAIMRRFGQPLNACAAGGPALPLVTDYIGQLCASLVFTLSPQRIVIGGGVGKTPGLIPAAHAAMLRHLAGYAANGLEQPGFICSPALGDDAGIKGALLAAARLGQAPRQRRA